LQENLKYDEIMLGFGHGYLSVMDSIISEVKQMRNEIISITGLNYPAVHIIDHDYDYERNIVLLEPNEFIIRINYIEKIRRKCDDILINTIIEDFKKVILENISLFN